MDKEIQPVSETVSLELELFGTNHSLSTESPRKVVHVGKRESPNVFEKKDPFIPMMNNELVRT